MSIKLLLPNGISKLIQYIFSKSNFLSRILLRDQEKLQEDNQESSNLKSRYGNLPFEISKSNLDYSSSKKCFFFFLKILLDKNIINDIKVFVIFMFISFYCFVSQ